MSTTKLKATAFFLKTKILYQTLKVNVSLANTEHDLCI